MDRLKPLQRGLGLQEPDLVPLAVLRHRGLGSGPHKSKLRPQRPVSIIAGGFWIYAGYALAPSAYFGVSGFRPHTGRF